MSDEGREETVAEAVETPVEEPAAAGAPEQVPEEAGFPVPDQPVLADLAGRFPSVRLDISSGQRVAFVPRGELVEFAAAARDAGFESCVDITAVDYLRRRPRYEVVAMLLSMAHRLRLRLRVDVPGDDPTVPSLVPVYPGANFYEREAFDMFGIVFTGHPDLTRILMPDDWEGHPMRKDYPVGTVPVQFKSANEVR